MAYERLVWCPNPRFRHTRKIICVGASFFWCPLRAWRRRGGVPASTESASMLRCVGIVDEVTRSGACKLYGGSGQLPVA